MVGCTLCPRMCGAQRETGERGFCGAAKEITVARAALHHWEEPCISGAENGARGSGTVFFAGCPLGCVFCQNREISHKIKGKAVTEERLAALFLELQEKGAYNINLVTATPYTDTVLQALDRVRGTSLHIPVVWNSGGYERVETLKRLDGYIDIYLPDFKFTDSALGARYTNAPDYPEVAEGAILEMQRQTGKPTLDGAGILQRGTLVRHLVLPGARQDSIRVIERLAGMFSPDDILLSLMSQYTPYGEHTDFPELRRRITSFEYRSACDAVLFHGFRGYFQKKTAAQKEYTPSFDGEGV